MPGDGVGVAGAIAQETGERAVMLFVPEKDVGLGGEDQGFGFGVIAVGALEEPVGAGGGADEFGFVLGIVTLGIQAVAVEPAGFEGFEVSERFGVEKQRRDRAGTVLECVA